MRILANRITISLLVILALTYVWEFWVKPVSGPEYTAAVTEYKNGNYKRSLGLLREAYAIDPNDTAILTLIGWDELKLGDAKQAESYFSRAHRLVPSATDTIMGYAYTEIALKKYESASGLLSSLRLQGVNNADTHLAWGTLYHDVGQNREAANEFKQALELRSGDPMATRSLRELYNLPDTADTFNLQIKPVVRETMLTYTSQVQGEHFTRLIGGEWKPVYWTGMDLNAALPGEFPVEADTRADVYADWLQKISNLGVNTLRITTVLPPAFYRALYQFNTTGGHPPIWLLQGITFPLPPQQDDLFQGEYYRSCRAEIEDAVDTIHGEGDVPGNHLHAGGLYPNDVSQWVAGLLIGDLMLSHVVLENNQLHPDIKSFQGKYFNVPSGSQLHR
jgi:tetratricopeptide (TPR) repeat protein